ncbi:hypothetical protein G3H63_01770 [Microbacterium resistens]|uniref:hypothetical protein n=1 Tax=Microbacterium resistens TaxID=156977 RepID=UPI001C59B52B|nr:hypothetical protein [Microbacterium resistens]MBW1637815.1 hypothetical protein [Microbacterium resistens]
MVKTDTDSSRTRLQVWIGGALALVVAVIAIVSIWGIALPLTPPGGVCAAIHPPTAGCAGDARLLPATVWTVLIAGAVVVTTALGRRGWWGSLTGFIITGLAGYGGYLATWRIEVFLFPWGG